MKDQVGGFAKKLDFAEMKKIYSVFSKLRKKSDFVIASTPRLRRAGRGSEAITSLSL